jgi:hypothetical protein
MAAVCATAGEVMNSIASVQSLKRAPDRIATLHWSIRQLPSLVPAVGEQ